MLAFDYARAAAVPQGEQVIAYMPPRSREVVDAAARDFPAVTEEEAQRARGLCRMPAVDADFSVRNALSFYALLLALLAVPALIASVLFRGGTLLRLAGIVMQTRDGRPAGRWRCLLRSAAAWSPGLATLILSATNHAPLTGSLLWVVCAAWLAGATWGILRPERGLPDVATRTWQVPR